MGIIGINTAHKKASIVTYKKVHVTEADVLMIVVIEKPPETGGLFDCMTYALIFSFATPASELNALISFTARSASILRFISIPASFRPWISLL